jgi:hypothetical protein
VRFDAIDEPKARKRLRKADQLATCHRSDFRGLGQPPKLGSLWCLFAANLPRWL